VRPRRAVTVVAAVLVAAVCVLLPVRQPEAVGQEAAGLRYVIIVSFDGLRPDALRAVMPAPLLARAAFTWQARTILPSVTLPSHTSMLTGVAPAVHRMLANSWSPSQDYVKVPTVFSVATEARRRSAMFVTKQKLLYLARPGTVTRAEFLVFPRYDQTAAVREAMRHLAAAQPHLLFIHVADLDDIGHRDGWMSPPYLEVVRSVPSTITLVLDTLTRMLALDRSLFIATADHGGHGRVHGSDRPEDVTIPWLAFGAVTPGPIERPVTTYDTAATAVSALGLAVPAGWHGRPVLQIRK
jgi:predicted AlkP superfamily pyrophosphatase or phosphodiesterase